GHGNGLLYLPEGEARLDGFLGLNVFAVFRIAPSASSWAAFDGATYAIVLSAASDGFYPRAAVVAVNDLGRIVGLGEPCGATPTFYLKDVGEYLLEPVSGPTSPATGNALPRSGNGNAVLLFGFALAAVGFGLEI